MNDKRAKVLKRREFLRRQKKQERLDKLEAEKRFAEANPTPKLEKIRTVRFRNMVQEVESIPVNLSIPGLDPQTRDMLQQRYDTWTQNQKVMEAVQRRRECRKPNT